MKFVFPFVAGSGLLVAFASGGQGVDSKATGTTPYAANARARPAATPADKPPFHHPLLTTEAIAIAVAEPILFSVYGQENIMRQRPYRAQLSKGCWHLSGTLHKPAATVGGTFYLVIEASNCRVHTLFHTK